jgi:hypothetical protein
VTQLTLPFEAAPMKGSTETPMNQGACKMNCLDLIARSFRGIGLVALFGALSASTSLAGPREQAKRMHDRLVGSPPSTATLDAMTNAIATGDPLAAANEAMENPLFYTSTLKTWVTPWTNEAQTVHADLNDYTATVIGMIRDNVPFRDVLSADLVYVGAAGVVQAPYSHTNNDHYIQLEEARVDLSNPQLLVPTAQSALGGAVLTSAETAGVITTRAAGEAFFSAGTNRRMWRFVAVNYLCRDMEELNDITRPSDWIRQDVSRSPGGDSIIFHNTCVGCHSGMDALAGAFAYYEWDDAAGRVVHTPNQVQPKYLINSTSFPYGFITFDNSWINYWRSGPNSALGWRGNGGTGSGAKSLGQEVANSRAFSECQVQKSFEKVCLHPPANPTDRAEVKRIADVFEAQNYSMKRVFAEVATYCMGQ